MSFKKILLPYATNPYQNNLIFKLHVFLKLLIQYKNLKIQIQRGSNPWCSHPRTVVSRLYLKPLGHVSMIIIVNNTR